MTVDVAHQRGSSDLTIPCDDGSDRSAFLVRVLCKKTVRRHAKHPFQTLLRLSNRIQSFYWFSGNTDS